MKTAASQLQIPFRAIKRDASAPLMSVNAAMGKLELSELEVMNLIEGHPQRIAWAWDIGTSDRQRDVRILARSVNGYFTTADSDEPTCGLAREAVASIVAHILAREKKPFISCPRLAVLFVCTARHIMNLVKNGDLQVLPGTGWRRGPSGSANITKTSVEQFLTERRIK